MRHLLRLAAQLYPSWWRQRYGREFEALLEDGRSGWRELFDVLAGAVTMQIRTLGTIPVLCAVAGAAVGGVIAARTPQLFASSATLRAKAAPAATQGPVAGDELLASVRKVLGESPDASASTKVMYRRGESADATLKLTYLDRDRAQSQRIAATLTAAIASDSTQRGVSTEVLVAPRLPAAPVGRDDAATIGSGAGLGFVGGGVVFLLLRARWRTGPAA